MRYNKEHKCEICGKIMIVKTSVKRFCENCKRINHNNWKRKYRQNPKNIDRIRFFEERWRNNNLDKKAKIQRNYSKKHPDRIKAHTLANYYLKHLKKRDFVFHHPDYSKPLDIIILPKKIHQKMIGGNQNSTSSSN